MDFLLFVRNPGVEHEHHPWAIGVQWHPELSILNPNNQRLFLALVQAAHTKHLCDEPNPGTG
ncbi:MAG: hypothetical protein V7K69_21450 [Nostoc sp.]|uniref:hypothetical protein n=1 Tax=Nostoc sp. TaxID=1180 RepID=UPI002FF8108C